MVKKTIVLLLLSTSLIRGQEEIQIKLKNGKTVAGEFIGTYMEYIHILKGENINYFRCDDIQSVIKSHIYNFDYDCSKNTVTADILFPPQINPMTGEWETIIPDIFNPKKRNLLAKEKEEKLARIEIHASEDKKPQEDSTEQNSFDTEKVLKEQLEKTKNKFQKVIDTKLKPAISSALYEDTKEEPYQDKTQTKEKDFSSSSTTNGVSISRKGIKEELTTYYYEDGAVALSEDEIRKFIKKEVRKEVRKTLPYEIRKHKEQKQNKLFQNILLGCGVWFLFMVMLS